MPGGAIRVLTWNLFHGRDAPPEKALFTRRSRLLRRTETGERHVQVNRPLREEFAATLAGEAWQLAFLQEAPPRWLRPLASASRANAALALTSRNLLPRLRGRLAELNPDLMASGEGGSNQLLARPPWRIAEVRRLTLTRRPERRRLLWARLVDPDGVALAIGNLHASVREHGPAEDVELAARTAVEWAGGDPLIFGGDLNLRVADDAAVFERLARRHELRDATPGRPVDHLLVRGLDVIEPPRQLPAGRRELGAGGGRLLRLSDHAPVVATFGMR